MRRRLKGFKSQMLMKLLRSLYQLEEIIHECNVTHLKRYNSFFKGFFFSIEVKELRFSQILLSLL